MRRVCALLLSCIAFLQLEAELGHGAAAAGENVDPFELARQLRAEICAMNRSHVQEFYKARRDEENRDRQFPGSAGKTTLLNNNTSGTLGKIISVLSTIKA